MAMRRVLLVVLACVLFQASAAARVAPAGRSLLVASGDCPTKIAGCDTGRCGTKQVDGQLNSVCERCKLGYIRANNGLQCVCPPGTRQTGTGAAAECVACEKGFFCPGGDRYALNSAPLKDIGVRYSCHKPGTTAAPDTATTADVLALGVTTKSTKAKRYTDCVPIAGYFLKVASRTQQEAQKCLKNTYSPGFSRLRACFRCQSGLEEPGGLQDAVTTQGALRTDRNQVCGVPEGRFLSQNVVRDCPMGTFRSTWELVTDVNARYCFPCPMGVTTERAASVSFGNCTVAQPGYDINWNDNVLAMATDGTLQDPATFPKQCSIGTYYPGGKITSSTKHTCEPCPLGTTTQTNGSRAIEDCMVPPGYFIKTTGTGISMTGVLTRCPTNVTSGAISIGYFREGWKSYLDITVRSATDGSDACTPCGEGILSLYTDIDEQGSGDDTSLLVAASAASCYIEPGWGMTPVPLEFNKWRANLCTNNSYGVAERTFGLQQSPCKPCQRNMITLNAGATNFSECINPAGYGFSSDGVTQCPKGYYTAQGSMSPCTPCPSGRTTDFDPLHPERQDNITDCYVDAGHGLFDTSFNVTPNNDTTDVNIHVLECPVGTYSNGGALNTLCTPCTPGYSTVDEGTAGGSNSACTVCAAGYGLPAKDVTTPIAVSGSCNACDYGTYQTGYTGVAGLKMVGDGRTCYTCRRTNYTYVGSKGKKARYDSEGITFYTKSTGPEACVPRYVQLMIDAGQIYSLPSTAWVAGAAVNAANCIASCMDVTDGAGGKACFAQFDYTDTSANTEVGTCKTITLDIAAGSATSRVLLVKMMPSDPIAAASVDDDAEQKVSAKAMASGLYSRVVIPEAWDLPSVGQTIGSATTEKACREKCDQNSLCWGIVLDSGSCTLRTGADSLDSRSFFFNPKPASTAGNLEAKKW